MNSNILEDLLHHELQSIYSTEKQMHKALTKMTQVACDSTLRTVFMRRLRERDDQVQRLEHIARLIGKGLEGPKCQGMKQLIEEEARESLFNSPSRHETYDAGLIAAASQFVSDEIDRYDLAGGLRPDLGLRTWNACCRRI